MKILFICKYNRFRSRVAAAYFKKINKNSKIKVESAGKDMGTTFIVSLPAGEQEITNSVEK